MKSLSPRLPFLVAGALGGLLSLAGSHALHAQGPRRLYGILDAESFGNIAFSIDLAGTHDIAYHTWGRNVEEVEGMAVDGEGELYLFSESGVVKKVDLRQPASPPVQVRTSGFDLTSATTSASGEVMELYDARGGQFVSFDPRTDQFIAGGTRRSGVPARGFDGLARTATGLYGIARVGRSMALFVCTADGCARTCPATRLPVDLQSIEAYAGTALVFAWTSITPGNQLMLHVETLDPTTCLRSPLASARFDLDRLRPLLRRQVNVVGMLGQARAAGRSVEIEALAVQ